MLTNGGKRLVWLLVSHNTHTHKSTIEMECIITLLALTLLTTKLSNSLHKHNGPSTTMSIQPVMCHFDGLSSRLILICLITLITITIRFIRNLCSYISYRSFLYSFFFIMSSLCSKWERMAYQTFVVYITHNTHFNLLVEVFFPIGFNR